MDLRYQEILHRVNSGPIDQGSIERLQRPYEDDGTTAVHVVAYKNDKETLHKLLDVGCDIQAVDNRGLNIIHWSVQGNQDNSVLEFLLDRQDCFHLFDKSSEEEGFTPLACSLKNGNTEAAKYLLQLDGTPTKWSTEEAYKVNFQATMDAQNLYKLAMEVDNPELVYLLVERDSDWLNHILKRENGENAIMFAAKRKCWETVEFIMQQSSLTLDSSDLTYILKAICVNSKVDLLISVLSTLSERGNLLLEAELLHSTLELPNTMENKDIVKLLIEHGADVFGFNRLGQNVLHVVVSKGDRDLLSTIKEKLKGWAKLQELLRQPCRLFTHVGNTNNSQLQNCTVLHIATVKLDIKLTKDLITLGADPFTEDSRGKMPVELAIEQICDFSNTGQIPKEKLLELSHELLIGMKAKGSDSRLEKIIEQCGTMQQENSKSQAQILELNQEIINILEQHKENSRASHEKEIFVKLYKECCEGIATFPSQNAEELANVLKMQEELNGTTLLHMAAYKGLDQFLTELLENGCDVMVSDSSGRNVLHWAAQGKKTTKVLQLLLGKEECFELFDRSTNKQPGFTPFVCALENKNSTAAKMLLELDGSHTTWSADQSYRIDIDKGVHCGYNVYKLALEINDDSLMELLFKKDKHLKKHIMMEQSQFKVNHDEDTAESNEDAQNFFHVLVASGNTAVVTMLEKELGPTNFTKVLQQECPTYKANIKYGDKMDQCELEECSALHIASVNMHVDMVCKLVELVVNPSVKDTSLDLVEKHMALYGKSSPGCLCKLQEIAKVLRLKKHDGTGHSVARKPLQDLEVKIDSNFNDVKTYLTEIKQSLASVHTARGDTQNMSNENREGLRKLEQTVSGLEHVLHENHQKVSKSVEICINEINAARLALLPADEITQYELMKSIAKEVSQRPNRGNTPLWEIMCDKLLENNKHLKQFAEVAKRKVKQSNKDDINCTLHFLLMYKSVACHGKMDFDLVKSVLKELNVNVEDLDKVEEAMGQSLGQGNSDHLSGNWLMDIATELGPAWRQLGTRLGMKTPVLNSINSKHQEETDKAFEMLEKWKQSTSDSESKKITKLSNALKHIDRQDLGEQVQRSVTCIIL